MCKKQNIILGFADISVEFIFPTEIEIPRRFEIFLVNHKKDAHVTYEIRLLNQPLSLPESAVWSCVGMQVYHTKEGILRNYTPLTEKDGCQVACLLRENQKHILYYPAKKWDYYSKDLYFLHLIGMEDVLLRHQALLLHSSVVKLDEHTVLFSGPSGMGKSTQARLWEMHLGAEIINGDRCVVKRNEHAFWGCGSLWSGSSAIYSREMAPIKGIFILKQAPVNRVRKMGAEAFKELYSQCIINTWNREFTEAITDLLTELLEKVPVYELACRPDQEAAELAYRTLYEGGFPIQ